MRQIKFLACLIAMPILFSNCASILNPKYQKVTIRTGVPDSKVYINDELAGEGRTIVTRLERNTNAQQVRVEREGYKSNYFAHLQYKRPILYLVSWVPFGYLSLMPPLLDNGPKAFDYDKEFVYPQSYIPILTKQEDQKYLYIKSAAFNVDKNDFTYKRHDFKRFTKGGRDPKAQTSDENLELGNTIFAAALQNVLHENGFTDTTKSILRNYMNSLYIKATVTKVEFNQIKSRISNGFFTAGLTVDWEIVDIYGQTKLKKTISSSSGQISRDFYQQNNEFLRKVTEDALQVSFLKLLQNPQVDDLLKLEDPNNLKLSNYMIVRPKQSPKSLGNAQNATVTVVTEDGHGSGVFISNNGYIVTNFHVVALSKEKLEIVDSKGKKYNASLIRSNEYADLALLKVDEEIKTAYAIPVTTNFEVGQDVYAIGTPTSLELGQTMSRGIVSGIRTAHDLKWIQTDVSVNPGNSGGALVNNKGELVGIVSAKVMGFGVEGIAFCIPAEEINQLLSLTYK